MKPLILIESLRNTDPYIAMIFTQGGCYQFHKFLYNLYPNKAKLYINKKKDHVVTKIDGNFYDILGIVKNKIDYIEATNKDIEMCQTWSFSKQKMLILNECPVCEEPICI